MWRHRHDGANHGNDAVAALRRICNVRIWGWLKRQIAVLLPSILATELTATSGFPITSPSRKEEAIICAENSLYFRFYRFCMEQLPLPKRLVSLVFRLALSLTDDIFRQPVEEHHTYEDIRYEQKGWSSYPATRSKYYYGDGHYQYYPRTLHVGESEPEKQVGVYGFCRGRKVGVLSLCVR